MEFMFAEVPYLTFPHFGDQRLNADNAIRAGIAIPLFDTQLSERFPSFESLSYKEPIFNASQVTTGLRVLLNEPIYKQNIRKLKFAALATGGSERMTSAIQDYYVAYLCKEKDKNYIPHLTDSYFQEVADLSHRTLAF